MLAAKTFETTRLEMIMHETMKFILEEKVNDSQFLGTSGELAK